MKKRIFIWIALCILIISGIFLFNKDSNKSNKVSAPLAKTSPITYKNGNLNILIDPRIELLVSVQLISGYDILTKNDSDYKRDMITNFSNFKNSKAITLFQSMSHNGYNYHVPPASMLYYSNPQNMEKVIPLPNDLLDRCEGQNSLSSFISEMNNFSTETNFSKFYNDHINIYNRILDQVKNDTKGYDFVSNLEDYYGLTQNSYNIILSPLLHPGGYGISVKNPNGKNDIYGIIGPNSVENGLPVFSKSNIRYIVWHEFSHSFVNPITAKYLKDVSTYSNLYTPIADTMDKMAYGDWESCVNEHIIRAITARLTSIYDSPESAKDMIRQEKSKGFVYIDKLYEKLEVYEKSRDKYKTFEDFYPELINAFKEYSSMNLSKDFYEPSFQGAINSSSNSRDPIVIIVPTEEDNSAMKDIIRSYAEGIKNNYFKSAHIITDKEALKLDLSNNFIIAYGTVNGNLWLSKYKNNFPFKIEKDKIIAGKEYSGNNLRLISIYPNPQNNKKSLLIYTAQRAEDIAGINSVFHGPTDYVIASDRERIVSDYYNKGNDKWSF